MNTKTLIISDIHLGMLDSKAEEVCDLLDKTQFERLVLLGDIIDGWALARGAKWKPSHMKCIRKIMKAAQKGKQVIWLMGNHDDFLRDWIPFDIGSITICDRYDLMIGEKKYLLIHGDVFDVFITNMKWLAKIGSIGYDMALFLNRWYNRYRKCTGKPYFSLSKKIKESFKQAASFINKFEDHISDLAQQEGYHGVICGHIHKAEVKTMANGIHYLNSGDWIESMTYIIEDDSGDLSLHHYC